MSEVPPNYKNAGIVMLVAGIMHMMHAIILGVIIFLYASVFAISTFGIGCVCYGCLLWPVLPAVVGVGEAWTGYRVMSGERVPFARTMSIIGLVNAAVNMNVVTVVLEILALMWLGEPASAAYANDESDNVIDAA